MVYSRRKVAPHGERGIELDATVLTEGKSRFFNKNADMKTEASLTWRLFPVRSPMPGIVP